MLTLTNIHKSFGNDEILKGISLKVNRGEVVSILGPSGSGKTTLLRCINFLEEPNKGEIEIDGLRVSVDKASQKDTLSLRRKTAMVFQSYSLFANKTALENITEGLIIVKKLSKKAAEEKGLALLSRVGLAEKAHAYPAQLSGGQQQRVGIARALALDPEVILFDEPTSALDPELVGEVLETIKSIAREGVTMIIVTHEMAFARDISTKIVFMEKGHVVEEGPPQQIFANSKEARTKEFIGKHAATWAYEI